MAAPPGTGSELLAIRLFRDLVGDLNADLPQINLFDATHTIPWDEDSDVFKPVEKITIEELVSHFHALMGGFQTHLSQEYDKNRITGTEYSKAYIALTEMAMQSAVQFALGKDQAFWMAAKTQADAITAQNQNEIARLEAMLRRATYALTKLKLAAEDSAFGASEFQRQEMLPKQKDLTTEQIRLTTEQMEAQRANTSDTRISDLQTVKGMIGQQKLLYQEQIKSYQEDVKLKAARVFTDLWGIQKTMDIETPPPPLAKDTKVNDVLVVVRAAAGVTAP